MRPEFDYTQTTHSDPESKYIGTVVIHYEKAGIHRVEEHEHAVGHWGFCARGAATYRIGQELHHLKSGQSVWVPANAVHAIEAGEDGTITICIMPGKAI